MQIGSTTTREERLGWIPEEAIAVLRGPGPDERGAVALAMFDQLEATRVPIDALDMAIMFWSRALDGLDPGPIPADRLARLDRDLALGDSGVPKLAAWNQALRSACATANDLDWAIQLLLQVRQTWAMTVQFRGVTPR